jgi:2-isopropylmalate synthase
MSNKVILYDTTLRDGAQREGLSFSVEDKLKITEELDRLGIDYIEGGMPASNPKDDTFFKKAKSLDLKHAKLVAFGPTRRKKTNAEDDPVLKAISKCGVKTACIFGKSWDEHVRSALKTTLAENLEMISDSVKFLKSKGMEVIYDAEHFFDAYINNREYAIETIHAAIEAGCDCLVLCDTNGGTLPHKIGRIVTIVREIFETTELGVHAHNDTDCAVAASLEAIRVGATQVQGTINGYGERSGNANLVSIIPNLILKMDKQTSVTKERLKLLTEVSHYISELANETPDSHQPYVGKSAFAHKAGIHISAVTKNPITYEHIKPETVGNTQRVLLSELSGKSTIVIKAKELGVDLKRQPAKVKEILKHIKQMESAGYYFEAADGSFEVLLRKKLDKYKPLFKLESFRVIAEKREDGKVMTEATIKLHCKGKRLIATAEGNGPVNALDLALRNAIEEVYPHLKDLKLSDYKVRVLDEKKGTGADVRVLIETTDGEKSWGTIGVHENIIEASWEALVDSLQYGLTR